LDKGCDIIAQHQDSTAAQTAAEERGAFAIGYNTPTPDAAPGAYLTAPLFNWANFYVADVQRIVDGTWKAEKYWAGMEADMVALDSLTDLCAPGTQEKVDEAAAAILDGSLNIFAGPLYDQNGELKVAEGSAMTDDEVWTMGWFVQGVIGNLA
jgi:basic membrane protein A